MYTTFMGFILLVMVLSNLNKKFCFCVSVIEREHTWLVVLTTWYIFTQKVEPFLYFEKAKEFIVKILVETCCNLSWYKLLTIQKRFLGNYILHLSKWARNGIVVWGKDQYTAIIDFDHIWFASIRICNKRLLFSNSDFTSFNWLRNFLIIFIDSWSNQG